jgi:hypothetical protein
VSTATPGGSTTRSTTCATWGTSTGTGCADQFLGQDLSTGEYTGLAEDWWQRSVRLGRRITHWIVEQGATQNYL